MTPEELHIAQEVVARGSFAAAGRALGLDPSTVSRSVAGAEARLGLRLFDRTTRRLAPTPAGAEYLARIAPLVNKMERAREAAAAEITVPSGTLRLTTSVAYGTRVLIPRLPALREALPKIDLILTDAPLDLSAERIDLAIRLTAAPSGEMMGTRLHPVRYHVVAAPEWLDAHGALARPEDLAEHDCLRGTLPGHMDRWRLRRDGAVTEVPIQGPISISNPLALRDATLAGMGPALLADWLIGADLTEGTLTDLFPEHEATARRWDSAAHLLWPSKSWLPARTRAAIDALKAQLQATAFCRCAPRPSMPRRTSCPGFR